MAYDNQRMTDTQTPWTLKGTVLVACNCDFGCPCNFNAPPTTGKCEGGWTWVVEAGSFGDVRLDGLSFSVYANWPGAIHEGNGAAMHGPTPVRYDVTLDGVATRITAGDVLEVQSTTITNPVSGAQVHPGIVLPEGIVVKQADLGCSTVFRVAGAIGMDHSGQYTAVGPFDYRSA